MVQPDLFFYNDFTLVGILRQYSYLKWIRRYSDVGEFSLELILNDHVKYLVQNSNIISKGNYGEAAFIENYYSTKSAKGNEILRVEGRFLSSLLDRRIITYNPNSSDTPADAIASIVNNNFITAPDVKRRMPNLSLASYDINYLNGIGFESEYINANALDAVSEIAQKYDIGFRVDFDPTQSKYYFAIYFGETKPIIFSDGFFNILEQDYYMETKHHKTMCYVDYGGSIVEVNGVAEGWDRREMYMQADTELSDSATSQGDTELYYARKIESFDTVINMETLQFPYLDSWDLGDIVTCENLSWKKTLVQNIKEVTEYYDKGGVHIAPVFGDYLRKKQ
jgi:hypothetical protein